MIEEIQLSERAQELISALNLSDGKDLSSPMLFKDYILWLAKTELNSSAKKESLQALHIELLQQILSCLSEKKEEAEENAALSAKIQFILLALAGLILAGSEGFDAMITMLGIFNLPILATFLTGLAFALLSIIVFYGCDLMELSHNLDVSLIESSQLLDKYVLQFNIIKSIREKIEIALLAEENATIEQLEQYEMILSVLQLQLKEINLTGSHFVKAKNSPFLHIVQTIISSVVGLMFFGSGFFAGQSVAMYIAAIFMPVVLPTFWPVIAFSILVGFAALALYCYIDKIDIQYMVSSWFGLDVEKIAIISEQTTTELDSLQTVKGKINARALYKNFSIFLSPTPLQNRDSEVKDGQLHDTFVEKPSDKKSFRYRCFTAKPRQEEDDFLYVNSVNSL